MGKLYLVPTPVGNLEDITLRALKVLKEADLILAEDTRTSGILLAHFEIKNRLCSHHKFNEHQTADAFAARMAAGEVMALISDAGTPGISDPGFMLVRALVASGLPCERFTFEGFLPQKKGRATRLESLQAEERTMIFYESPYRVVKTLTQFVETFGAERRMSACREISKLHEESVRGTIAEVLHHFEENAPRGEFVLVVEGAETAKQSARKARRERARKDSEEGDSTTDF